MDRLIEWLPAHMPASARDETQVSVVHGDFRLDNLIFHPTEPRMLAVLDWELSTLGHPLADFSYHCMAWHIPPGAFRGIGGLDLAALGIPTRATTCAAIASAPAAADAARRVMADWNFYLAYNLFRLAAILQGIAKRVRRRHRRQRAGARQSGARRAAAGRHGLAVRAAGLTPIRTDHTRRITMDFGYSAAHRRNCRRSCRRFMDEHVYPAEARYCAARSRPTPRPASAGRRCR